MEPVRSSCANRRSYLAEPLYGTQALIALPCFIAHLSLLTAKLDDWGKGTWLDAVTPLVVMVVVEVIWT